MPETFETRPAFDVSPVALDEARAAMESGEPLALASGSAGNAFLLAPLIPMATRVGLFQQDVERAARAAARTGTNKETVDTLLAVALTLARRFPDVL